MLMRSEMRLYFMILSADVVEVRDGEAFTWKTRQGRELESAVAHSILGKF